MVVSISTINTVIAPTSQSCLPFSNLFVTLSFSIMYTCAPQPDSASLSTALSSACEMVSNRSSGPYMFQKVSIESYDSDNMLPLSVVIILHRIFSSVSRP